MTEVETPTRWSLADLLPDPVEKSLEGTLAELEEAVLAFEGMRQVLTSEVSVPDFKAALVTLEKIVTLKSRLEAYAELAFSADTQSPAVLNLRDRVDQVATDVGNRCLYFDLWFTDLPDDVAARLIAQVGDLRYFLETIRKFKPFMLSEAEEKIINSKDVNGIDAIVNLSEMLTSAFVFTLDVDGEKKSLTRDELTTYFQSPSADVRARAYQELFRVYEQNSTLMAQMYVHRVRDWHAEGIELRGYASPIAARNLENDLPDDVVETLLEVCGHNAVLFQRYFRLKARLLGLDKLRRYDLYAPLATSDKRYDYSVAKQMIMDSYEAFSPDVAALAKRVFDENHLDSEIRKGKQGGAFCYTVVPALTPWVLTNYNGQARDIPISPSCARPTSPCSRRRPMT
jgi:oligoendopeptidase F